MGGMKEFLEDVADFIPLVCFAIFGVVVHYSYDGWTGWRNFLASAITSGFGAVMVGFIAQDLGLSEGVTMFIAGAIGYSGGKLVEKTLDVAGRRIDRM
jgi:hypothetical protein